MREGRRRQFGGTANLWNHKVRGGYARHIRYVPLDEIDFERRDWVPESDWPFSRREIQPFYERAQQVCGIGNPIIELGLGTPWRKTASPSPSRSLEGTNTWRSVSFPQPASEVMNTSIEDRYPGV